LILFATSTYLNDLVILFEKKFDACEIRNLRDGPALINQTSEGNFCFTFSSLLISPVNFFYFFTHKIDSLKISVLFSLIFRLCYEKFLIMTKTTFFEDNIIFIESMKYELKKR